uniref:Putative poly-A polymerase domain containing protein n=1 Tax=viral metagenome TaxID=1070528 RepID=A0A6H1ZD99_9ZZZZ
MKPSQIIDTLEKKGHTCFYTGGFVRDHILLGIQAKDIDLVTSATPEQLKTIFSKSKVEEVGKSFGVLIIDGTEVATYRKDIYTKNELTVEFGSSLEEDSRRRDFTFNAIGMDKAGKYYDYHGGLFDYGAGLIRFIGDPNTRIEEDPNRILRACRFFAFLTEKAKRQFRFEKNTLKALKMNSSIVLDIDKERIHKEIITTLSTTQKASLFFIAIKKIGILSHVFPSIDHTIGVLQNRYHAEDLFTHSMLVGDSISTKYPILKLVGYLHDVGKVRTKEFLSSVGDYTFYDHETAGAKIVEKELVGLKFSNFEIDKITSLIKEHMRSLKNLLSDSKGFRKALNKFELLKINYRDYLRIRIADRQGKLVTVCPPTVVPYSISEIRELLLGFKGVHERGEPTSELSLAITGFDIMDTLKTVPGPLVGKVKKDLLALVIEDPTLNTRDNLLKLVYKLHSTKMLPPPPKINTNFPV